MPPFLIPSLCLAIIGWVVLLIVKAITGHKLPLRNNAILAMMALVVECLCLYAGMMLDQRFGTPGIPWVGKVFSILGLLVFTGVVFKRSWSKEIGFCFPLPKSWVATLASLIALGLMNWVVVHYASLHQPFSASRLLFMMLLSGVDEELVFRGLMPSLLLRSGDDGYKGGRFETFLALATPTLIFALIHAWRFQGGYSHFNILLFVFSGIGGCLLMYVRRRSGSLLSSVLVHNVANAATVAFLA